jgi:hypothetical protein
VTRARMTSFPSQQGQNSTNSRLLSQVPGLIESFAMCQDISSAPKRPYTRRRRHRKYVDPLIFGLLNSVVCRPAQRVSCYLLRREVCGVKLRRTDLVMIGTGLFLNVAAGAFQPALLRLAVGRHRKFSLLLFNLFRTSYGEANQTKSTILGLNVGRVIRTNRPRNQSLGSRNYCIVLFIISAFLAILTMRSIFSVQTTKIF